MTREEFEQAYAERSHVTVEQLREFGREARPCLCDSLECHGWQMVNAKEFDEDFAAYKRGEQPHP